MAIDSMILELRKQRFTPENNHIHTAKGNQLRYTPLSGGFESFRAGRGKCAIYGSPHLIGSQLDDPLHIFALHKALQGISPGADAGKHDDLVALFFKPLLHLSTAGGRGPHHTHDNHGFMGICHRARFHHAHNGTGCIGKNPFRHSV